MLCAYSVDQLSYACAECSPLCGLGLDPCMGDGAVDRTLFPSSRLVTVVDSTIVPYVFTLMQVVRDGCTGCIPCSYLKLDATEVHHFLPTHTLSERLPSSPTRAHLSTYWYDSAHSLQTQLRVPSLSVEYIQSKEGCILLMAPPLHGSLHLHPSQRQGLWLHL